MTNLAQIDYNDKSVDGVLWTRTWGIRLVGADKSTELRRHPHGAHFLPYLNYLVVTRLALPPL